MKRAKYIPLPSGQHGLRWATLCAITTAASIVLAHHLWPSLSSLDKGIRGRLFTDGTLLLQLMDVVLFSHLAFTAASSLARAKPEIWREGDTSRVIGCFRSAAPGWSWWFAGMTLLAYGLPMVTSSAFPLGAGETTPTSGVYLPTYNFLTAIHGALLVVLVSAAVWSWVTWLYAYTRVTFGGPMPPALRLYGSGSTLLLEHDHGMEMLRVFGMLDGPWDPSCLLVRDRIPTYRLSGAEPERADQLRVNAPIQDSPGRKLILPASVDSWVSVGLVAAALAGACFAFGWGALGPFVLLGALAVGLLIRDNAPSAGWLGMKVWNWGSSVPLLRRVYVGGGCLFWLLALTIHCGGLVPWTFDVLCMALLLWIPFWLGFVEPRRFVRLRDSRLQLRMHGVWLPITDVHAIDERLLDLWCGPLRVPIGTQVWMGPRLSGHTVAARMVPYLSFWEPRGKATS